MKEASTAKQARRAVHLPATKSAAGATAGASSEVNLCVVGVGSWGRQLLGAFARTPRCKLKYVCDVDADRLAREAAEFGGARTIARYEEALADDELDAVAISTEAATHFELARAALTRGKHVFVEKPMALSVADASELIAVAERAGRKLMVGHVLEYHPAVHAIAEMIRGRELGEIYYLYTQRINLGVVRKHENAWWSLAPHDIAVICRLFDAEPRAVAAQGRCFLQKGVEDVVFATLQFADGRLAHVHVSWLDPHKIRRLTLVGTLKMVTFDDMSANEKVRVYDKGVERGERLTAFPDAVTLRLGDIVIPRIAGDEPLALECGAFIDAILDDRPIIADGPSGLRVVRVLAAGQRSLESNGGLVCLDEL